METDIKVAPDGADHSDSSGFVENITQRLRRAVERTLFDERVIEDARQRILNAECSLADYEPDPGFEEKESLVRANLERLLETIGKVSLGHVGHGVDASILEVQRAFKRWWNLVFQRPVKVTKDEEVRPISFGGIKKHWIQGRPSEWWMQPHIEVEGVLRRRHQIKRIEQTISRPKKISGRYERRLAAVQRRYRIQVAWIRTRAAARPTPQAQRGELVKALNRGEIKVVDYKKALADFKKPPKQFWKRSRAVFEKGVDDKNVPSKKDNKQKQQQKQKGGKKQKKGQSGPSK